MNFGRRCRLAMRWALACGLGAIASFTIAPSLGASAIDGFDLPDTETRARYQSLLAEFRCPKCLNESIASSGAPIAVDLRRTVRRLIDEGESDAAIRSHLQARYGDFVLYDPPLRPATWLLWFSPLALLGVAVLVLVRAASRRRTLGPSDADRERARSLLRSAP